jgi:hypothetical protein
MSCQRNVMLVNCQLANCKLANCHVGEMSCWWNVMLVKCHVGELSCWRNVMLVKFHVAEMSCWWNVMLVKCHDGIVMLAKCHVGKFSIGELSRWLIVLLAKCHVGQVMWPCTLTFFPPWNSCTDACGFINEHHGHNFTAPLYFTPSKSLRQAAWRIPRLRQQPWLAWRGKISIPRLASRICVRREIAWRTTNAAHCCETHTNFYGAQLRFLANQGVPLYIVRPLF